MQNYLGETIILVENSPFKDFKKEDWILYFIERYGQYDGDHHKAWCLDQISRIVHDTPIIVKLAKWSSGHEEWRVSLDKPSENYLNWVKEMKDGEDGENTYSYEEGIAP